MELKVQIRKQLEPLLDYLVDLTYDMHTKILSNLPADMPEGEKIELVKRSMESLSDGLVESFKMIKLEDIKKKMEEFNGR